VHALRHTAGTRLYQEQRDLALMAAHRGHAGVDTARIYAKLAADDVERAVADWKRRRRKERLASKGKRQVCRPGG